MDELAKVRRVIAKQMPDAPHETLMTVDATTGQNGVRQAKLFGEAVGVTGIILTKLDGTAKGGIALAIANELGHPGQADRHRRAARGPAPVRRRRLRPRAAHRVAEPPRRIRSDQDMEPWVLWLIAAVILAIGEIATTGLLPGAVRGRRGRRGAAVGGRRGRDDRVGRLPRRLGRAAGRAAAARPRAPAHARRDQDGHGRAGRPDGDGRRADRQRRGRRLRAARRRDLDRARLRRGRNHRAGTRVQVLEIRGATALVSE